MVEDGVTNIKSGEENKGPTYFNGVVERGFSEEHGEKACSATYEAGLEKGEEEDEGTLHLSKLRNVDT